MNLPIKYYDPPVDAGPPSESEPPSSVPYLGILSESLVQHNNLVELNSPIGVTTPTPMRVQSGQQEPHHAPKESNGDTVVFLNHHQPGPSLLSAGFEVANSKVHQTHSRQISERYMNADDSSFPSKIQSRPESPILAPQRGSKVNQRYCKDVDDDIYDDECSDYEIYNKKVQTNYANLSTSVTATATGTHLQVNSQKISDAGRSIRSSQVEDQQLHNTADFPQAKNMLSFLNESKTEEDEDIQTFSIDLSKRSKLASPVK